MFGVIKAYTNVINNMKSCIRIEQYLLIYPLAIHISPIGYSLLAIPFWLLTINYLLIAYPHDPGQAPDKDDP